MNEAATLKRKLEKNGLTVVRSRRHYKVKQGDRTLAHFAVTPSDHRWLKNTLSHLKRAGCVIK